jgi:hypothetical protein
VGQWGLPRGGELDPAARHVAPHEERERDDRKDDQNGDEHRVPPSE